MSDVTALAGALGTALGTVGIRALPYLSDTFSPPVALVGVDTAGYHESFGGANGLTAYRFIVYAILARTADRAALSAVESYLSSSGASSIRAALEDGDPSLGGLAAGTVVVRGGPPAAISINGAEYVSCPFEVTVHA